MATPENPMAYLLAFGLRKIEQERPELANDQKYVELKGQLLQDADGHFREIQATYATVLEDSVSLWRSPGASGSRFWSKRWDDLRQRGSQVQVLRVNPELPVPQGGFH